MRERLNSTNHLNLAISWDVSCCNLRKIRHFAPAKAPWSDESNNESILLLKSLTMCTTCSYMFVPNTLCSMLILVGCLIWWSCLEKSKSRIHLLGMFCCSIMLKMTWAKQVIDFFDEMVSDGRRPKSLGYWLWSMLAFIHMTYAEGGWRVLHDLWRV